MEKKRPLFSIIVPTYNRPGQLALCLEALSRLDYPRDRFEVIVVDDGSIRPTETVVTLSNKRLDVRLLTQVHAGPASARNTGAAQSEGEWLVFTDDDCAPASNWLQALSGYFDKAPDCAIAGGMVNALPGNPYSTSTQLIIDYLHARYNNNPKKASFLTSSNLAVPARQFRAMRGFDTTFSWASGEDREFCDRWLGHGYRLTYAPEALVYHSHMLTLHTFCRQHFNYGRGAFRFRQVRSCWDFHRSGLEPLSFYLKLLRYPLFHSRNQPALLIATLCMISQMANAVGYLRERIRRGDEMSYDARKSLVSPKDI